MNLRRLWENARYRTRVRGVPPLPHPRPYLQPDHVSSLAARLRDTVRLAAEHGALDAGNAGDYDADIDAAVNLDRLMLDRERLERRAEAARTHVERAQIAAEACELVKTLEERVRLLDARAGDLRAQLDRAVARWRTAQERQWRQPDSASARNPEGAA